MSRLLHVAANSIASALFCTAALAGPEWIELDIGAGDNVRSAQPTGGSGSLAKITGGLDGGLPFALGKVNGQDMYIIRIISPENFSATTVPANGHAAFDSQLWLFTIDGHGLLGNDDTLQSLDGKSGCIQTGSTLTNMSDDGTNQGIPGPGLYLLAISSTGTVPVSDEGEIFFLQSNTEVSGPDGPGGTKPLEDWAATGDPIELGSYSIFVTGTGMSGLFLDIKPGGCPNSHNVMSLGVLPVSICGTDGFNPLLINPATVVLVRADGIGGQVPLVKFSAQIEDAATPFTGNLCNCHELEGDSIDDLSVKFDSVSMRSILQLDKVPPLTQLALEVRGELVNGTPFGGADCIRITPNTVDSLFSDN